MSAVSAFSLMVSSVLFLRRKHGTVVHISLGVPCSPSLFGFEPQTWVYVEADSRYDSADRRSGTQTARADQPLTVEVLHVCEE